MNSPPTDPARAESPPEVLDYASPRVTANSNANDSFYLGWISLACIVVGLAGSSVSEIFVILVIAWPFAALAAVIKGAAGLRQARQLGGVGRNRARLGLLLGTASLLVLAAGIFMVPTGIPRERALRVRCAANLREIGRAMMLYAHDHQGQYPTSFDPLITEINLPTKTFVCPASADASAVGPTTQAVLADFAKPRRCSYILYRGAGLTNADAAHVVLAFEKLENHDSEGANFLFADGHVEWIVKPLAGQAIAELQAGQNPPPNLK